MIIHRYQDGSEGYQYQTGDRVLVERTIHGGWFDVGPVNSNLCKVVKIEKGASWHSASLEVSWSPDWGAASCCPWHLQPHYETIVAATVLNVQ